MNQNKVFTRVGGVLLVLASVNAQAQGSDAVPASGRSYASDVKAIKAADHALQKSVVRALSKTKGLRAATITVRAHNGVVILEGTVPEQAQVALATQAAEGVEGVKSVTNAVTLSTL
ncbi:putative periplasmic or secreted lipoprotein [Burkholderia sp. Ch1-1]|uniref:Periplasmic or secreted lipoprotein n=1 Tax=Paraburkholderia dioscoreae TaxID=2604047 RepID=A0A5Q4YX37_9BURK|nr:MULTISPECIES: BON domain-containing protein [Paraburkholderia]EIF35720.1 putative periplasmic or secreted lipoprotein [Burkholderia sp. Ch1-1]MDR8400446.1 BON domain-containing protein [Paraburkholderia sp. USG1]VVD31642.1 Putative periplasmic or secreted lipoprotein [Paraburkholderia dioscoreae]